MDSQRKAKKMMRMIVACIEAPRLRRISKHHLIEFWKAKELYEKQTEEKSKQSDVKNTPTTYKASIENLDLDISLPMNGLKHH